MNTNDLWKGICSMMKKNKFAQEIIIQNLVEGFFMQMEWYPWNGEITRPAIPLGSSNTGIPDLVLSIENKYQICIEIKRLCNELTLKNRDQLISYMRQLKLKYGILWGECIQVYCDDDDGKKTLVCQIDYCDNNELGIKLVDLLKRDKFKLDDFARFCEGELLKQKNKEKEKEYLSYLCSEKGVQHIKDLLCKEYPSAVVDKLKISITDKPSVDNNMQPKTIAPYAPPKKVKPVIVDDDDPDLTRRDGEKIQDWVKRILTNLYNNNKLSDTIIKNMHDLDYSKQAFGIAFPLLVDNEKDTKIAGHIRYWLKWMLGPYYVCNDWWLKNEQIYVSKINAWLERVNR